MDVHAQAQPRKDCDMTTRTVNARHLRGVRPPPAPVIGFAIAAALWMGLEFGWRMRRLRVRYS